MIEMLPELRPGAENKICLGCGAFLNCQAPFMPDDHIGTLPVNVLFVGEAPGADEDQRSNKPFTGKAGELLREVVARLEFEFPKLFESYAFTNVVICRPPGNKLSEDGHEVAACKGHLFRRIKYYQPKLIVLLGATALKAVLNQDTMKGAHGQLFQFPYLINGEYPKVFVTYHPAATFYSSGRDSLSGPKSFGKSLLETFIQEMNMIPGILAQDVDPQAGLELIECDTIPQIVDVLKKARACKDGYVAVDTESAGLEPHKGQELLTIQLSWEDNTGACIPWDHFEGPKWTPEEKTQIAGLLRVFFSDMRLKTIFQNAKHDILFLEHWIPGLRVKNFGGDTLLLHYLINEREPRNLEYMAKKYLGIYGYKSGPDEWIEKYNALEKLKPKKDRNLINKATEGVKRVPRSVLFPYGTKDAIFTRRLRKVLEEKVVAEGFEKQYREYLLPVQRAVTDMTDAGAKISQPQWETVNQSFLERIARTEVDLRNFPEVQQYEAEIGHPVLWTSDPQLRVLLFDRLHLPIIERTARTKQPSTSKYVLDELSRLNPIIKYILERKRVFKAYSAYIKPIPNYVNSDWILRADYRVDGTDTGRLSASRLAMQQIPWVKQIKAMFISKFDGGQIVSGDYSQIELRIMAAMSRDPVMVEGFRSGRDFHRYTASKIYRVPEEDVQEWQRRYTKTVNFGIPYGRGWQAILGQFHLTEEQGREIVANWWRELHVFGDWRREWIARCKRQGYSISAMGFRRWLPEIQSDDQNLSSTGERMSVNSPIQGDAARICCQAMARITETLIREGYRTRPFANVHDSISFDCPPEEVEVFKPWLKQEMERKDLENLQWLGDVPLTVDVKQGSYWGEWESDMADVLDSGLRLDDTGDLVTEKFLDEAEV